MKFQPVLHMKRPSACHLALLRSLHGQQRAAGEASANGSGSLGRIGVPAWPLLRLPIL
jgi:hypothetical protein